MLVRESLADLNVTGSNTHDRAVITQNRKKLRKVSHMNRETLARACIRQIIEFRIVRTVETYNTEMRLNSRQAAKPHWFRLVA